MRVPVPQADRLRIARGVLAATLCWVVLSALHLAGAFRSFDLKIRDAFYRISGERRASEEIAIVEIDDATIRQYPRWPIYRDQFALFLDAAERAGARAIGVDLVFLGPDPSDTLSDILLASVTAERGNILHAVFFLDPREVQPQDEPSSAEAIEAFERHGVEDPGLGLPEAAAVRLPYADLATLAPALAHVNVSVDGDGVTRRVPLVAAYRGRLYPAFALRLAGMARGDSTLPALEAASGRLHAVWPSGRRLVCPVDAEGGTEIDFAGDRDAFPHTWPFLEVLQWVKGGDLSKLRQAFGGKVVLLGSTAAGEAATDLGQTPYRSLTPLIYVHANALDAFLRDRFLRYPPRGLYLAFLVVLSGILGWLFVALPLPWAAGLMAASVLTLAGLVYGSFAAARLILPTTLSLLLPPLAYATIASYRFIFLEGKARERERELQVARKIQERLLPTDLPDAPELEVFGINIPAQEVGGDYYDWIPVGETHLAVALADVSGKGVSASLLMSHLRASFHAEARPGVTPLAMAEAMHASLYRATEPGKFATCFLVLFSRQAEEFVYVNAGHNPAFLLHDGTIDKLEGTGLPLGLFDPAPYAEERRPFGPGDTLVLYSDGVTEAMWKNALYTEERLLDLVARLAPKNLAVAAIGEAILADVRSFAHDDLRSDDVTIVVVRRRGCAGI